MQVNKLTESFYVPRTIDLDEELLVEGPIDWIKDKLSGKPVDQAEADRKAKEKTKKQIDKRKAKKDPKLLAQDLTSKNSKSKFYIDNNYDKPMNQNQWQMWLDKQQKKIDDMPPEEQDKKDKAQAKFDAQRYNAIVVDQNNYMMRRGAEDMEHAYQQLQPGVNDEIRNGYFMEPYKYKKYGAVKKSAGGAGKVNTSDLRKFLTICETTYMVIVDDKGKQIAPSEVKNIPLDQIGSYKVKLGNAGIPVPDWIKTAKSKKLI